MNETPNPISLYLRDDGSMLLTRGGNDIEIHLTPRQLLDFGADALRLALLLDASLGAAIFDVLDNTHIIPMEATCRTVN
ncbi:MAG TPA: hypothetical protein VF169_21555 [Albitalea sp.]|uniref:hypothetical protein n=1 Tax=Piscinibacter sp. TaxID=1903157 RepID=UPI002ED3F1DE